MDTVVYTGSTRTPEGIHVVSKALPSETGEHAFVLLQIHADTTVAKNVQKECLTLVKETLLEAEGDVAKRLDGTLKELNGITKGLFLSKAINDFHALLAVLTPDGELHISHAGRAEAYVVRAGTASQITEYTKGKSSPAFVHIASGQLEPGDKVVLSTQRLLRAITPAQLAQLTAQDGDITRDLSSTLEAEQESAALLSLAIAYDGKEKTEKATKSAKAKPAKTKRTGPSRASGALSATMSSVSDGVRRAHGAVRGRVKLGGIQSWLSGLLSDLRDPNRKKRANLFILAGIIIVFLIIWSFVQLSSLSERSQNQAELEALVGEVMSLIDKAENKRLVGEIESANTILTRAEEQVQQIINSGENNPFRAEGVRLDSLIRAKSEEINNIVRLSPRESVNLAARKPAVAALGIVGLGEEEFIAFDKQDLFGITYNNVDDPDRLSDRGELIRHGVHFPRYETTVFQVSDNSIVELINGQPSNMKTDDPAGWIQATDIEAYLRFLYMLSPENNQIYKYERLSNRYDVPDQYNVNGELTDAIDMAIDGNIYVLKEGGKLIKLLRGEVQPFTIRNLPDGALNNTTKLFKVFDGDLYILDPVRSRVVIVTDGGATGESSYKKQYIFEDVENLQDLYVDPEGNHLYLLDEKIVYKVPLKQ